ncbi:hypothetical protein A7982_12295 [Minicystis rosea]|nr:Hypothetical protein A7982_11471 [Minicystis rosea]APR86946.1 hypothetical protein A7982_12295 [Minicystis rosea]
MEPARRTISTPGGGLEEKTKKVLLGPGSMTGLVTLPF